jgi:hypothetical protein
MIPDRFVFGCTQDQNCLQGAGRAKPVRALAASNDADRPEVARTECP